jgi:hypothetical protein
VEAAVRASPIAAATVEIDAPIDVVWDVMTDAARYPEWNPFVVELRPVGGELQVGGPIELQVRWARGGGARTIEVVSRLDPPRSGRAAMEYRFVGWLPRLALVRGSRLQSIEQPAGGPTTYRTSERFTGLLARRVPLAKVQDGFERHARALKARAEALTRS